jgi:hypothetical protein
MTNETGRDYEMVHAIVLRHRQDLQGSAMETPRRNLHDAVEDETVVDMKKLAKIARSGDPEEASDILYDQVNQTQSSDTIREEYDNE